MENLTKLFAGYTIGPDSYKEIGRFCRPYGKNILLIGGKTALEKGKPRLDRALEETEGLSIMDAVVFGKECTYEKRHELRDRYQGKGVDMVFGMGGGKAMDTAKGVAWELGVPVFTFPTVPSNCAAMAALSVVYRPDGVFDSFYFYDRPAIHCFMDTDVLLHAPERYFRAGMGDTIAKYFECWFSARGDWLDYHSALGREISRLCYERICACGRDALRQVREDRPGDAFMQTVLTIVVNTGLVSHLVEDCYNCAVAHSVCYGLNQMPGLEEHFLHGDLVAYGVLVQLVLDQDREQAAEVKALLRDLGIPTTLADMGLPLDRDVLRLVVKETVAGPDMEHIPYPVTENMIWEAMKETESLEGADSQRNA